MSFKTPKNFIPGKFCQQRLTGDSGQLSNPETDDKELCVWIIEGKPDTRFQLYFSLFDMPDCDKSYYVLLRDGDTSDAPLLGSYCGWKDTPLYTVRPRGNKIWVEMRKSPEESGQFVLNWKKIRSNNG